MNPSLVKAFVVSTNLYGSVVAASGMPAVVASASLLQSSTSQYSQISLRLVVSGLGGVSDKETLIVIWAFFFEKALLLPI